MPVAAKSDLIRFIVSSSFVFSIYLGQSPFSILNPLRRLGFVGCKQSSFLAFSNSISEFSGRLLGFNCAEDNRCNKPGGQPFLEPPGYGVPDADGAPLPTPDPNGLTIKLPNDGVPELAADGAAAEPAPGGALVVEIARFDVPTEGAATGAAAGAEGADARAAGTAAFAGSAAAGAGATGVGAGVGAGAGGNSTSTSTITGLGTSLGTTLGVS